MVVAPNQTPTPKPDMNAEPEPQPESDPELQPEPAPESSQDSSEDTGIPPAVPDYPEDTGIPPAVPDAPEEPAVPPTDQNNAEAPSENQDSQTEQDALTPDQVLDAFAAELLAASPRSSLSTPASYTYGDESGMAVASGTLGAEKRDFNGDGMQELLVPIQQQAEQRPWFLQLHLRNVLEKLWKELHTEEHRPALSEKTEQDLISEWPAIILE